MTRVSRTAVAALLALSIPTIAAAQSHRTMAPAGSPDASAPAADAPAAPTPPAGGSMGAAPTAQDARSAGADASVTAGMPVQDSTGATIGKVTSVKPGTSGEQLATVQMGSDSFAVATDKLAVANGSAKINATQAEIKQMMAK